MPKLRARQWPHPVSRLKAKTPLCRLRSGGKGAAHKSSCAQKPLKPCKCSGARAADIPTAPRRNGRRLWGYAPACCGRLHESVPSSTLARSLPVRHEGRFTDTSPGLDVELPRHASSMWPRVVAGALLPCCWGIDLAASERKPVKLSCEDAESVMSPFGSGRPVRPCLVVNPGGGAAAPWAL